MEIKNYILEYLVNKQDCREYIDEDEECIDDFEASGEDNIDDWLESLIQNIEVIDKVNWEYNDESNSDEFNFVFKINSTYYSVAVSYSREYGINIVYYETLQQVIPKQKTITVYEPIDESL